MRSAARGERQWSRDGGCFSNCVQLNPSGIADNILLSAGWRTPSNMSGSRLLGDVAQRATMLDTLNKAPLIKEMWLTTQPTDTVPLPASAG